jgi:hypothetical protein
MLYAVVWVTPPVKWSTHGLMLQPLKLASATFMTGSQVATNRMKPQRTENVWVGYCPPGATGAEMEAQGFRVKWTGMSHIIGVRKDR